MPLTETQGIATIKQPPEEKRSEPVVTVKIPASLHSTCKKIAAFTDQTIEQVLTDTLRNPLAKRLKQILQAAQAG